MKITILKQNEIKEKFSPKIKAKLKLPSSNKINFTDDLHASHLINQPSEWTKIMGTMVENNTLLIKKLVSKGNSKYGTSMNHFDPNAISVATSQDPNAISDAIEMGMDEGVIDEDFLYPELSNIIYLAYFL